MKLIELEGMSRPMMDGTRALAMLWIRDDDAQGLNHEWTITIGYRNHCWTEQYDPQSRPQSVTDAVGEWEEARECEDAAVQERVERARRNRNDIRPYRG